jgi:hypothetical protein
MAQSSRHKQQIDKNCQERIVEEIYPIVSSIHILLWHVLYVHLQERKLCSPWPLFDTQSKFIVAGMGASSAKNKPPNIADLGVHNPYQSACQAIVVNVNTGNHTLAATLIENLPKSEGFNTGEAGCLRPVFTCCLSHAATEPFEALIRVKPQYFVQFCALGPTSAGHKTITGKKIEVLQTLLSRKTAPDHRTLHMLEVC